MPIDTPPPARYTSPHELEPWGPRMETVADMLNEAGEKSYPYQEGKAVIKLRYTHDAMVDAIIANPAVSQNKLAQTFGYTPGWVSLVMSSDAFRERLHARKAELSDPTILATIEERFRALTTRSLEILSEKLAAPASVVDERLALRCAELGAKVLAPAAAPAPSAAPDHLGTLAARLMMLQPRTIDAEVVEVPAVEIPK